MNQIQHTKHNKAYIILDEEFSTIPTNKRLNYLFKLKELAYKQYRLVYLQVQHVLALKLELVLHCWNVTCSCFLNVDVNLRPSLPNNWGFLNTIWRIYDSINDLSLYYWYTLIAWDYIKKLHVYCLKTQVC